MSIPLIIFLYVYLALLLAWVIFAFFNLFHMVEYSFWGFTAFLATFLFSASVIIVLFLSFTFLKGVDWHQTYELNLQDPFSSFFDTTDSGLINGDGRFFGE